MQDTSDLEDKTDRDQQMLELFGPTNCDWIWHDMAKGLPPGGHLLNTPGSDVACHTRKSTLLLALPREFGHRVCSFSGNGTPIIWLVKFQHTSNFHSILLMNFATFYKWGSSFESRFGEEFQEGM